MAFEPKDLRGALFKNTEKAEGSNQPDYRGDLVINGVKYRRSAWLKESTKGKFFSIAATPDEQRQGDAPAPSKPKPAAAARPAGGFARSAVDDDTIPFAPEVR